MKSSLRNFLPLASAMALALPVSAAWAADAPAKKDPAVKPAPAAAPAAAPFSITLKARVAKETAYLGVGLEEVPELAREHLNLPDGVGIAITHVAKASPAEAGGLLAKDILTALDDQIIINAPQLQTLIRSKGIGKGITLTLLRKGKEQKVKVTLAKGTEEWARQAQPAPLRWQGGQWMPFGGGGLDGGLDGGFGLGGQGQLTPEQLQELLKNLDFNGTVPDALQKQIRGGFFFGGPGGNLGNAIPGEGGRAQAFSIMANTSTLSDNTGTYTLSQKDGKKHFKARDKEGKELFDGVVDEKSREQLPENLLKKFEQLERIGQSGGKIRLNGLGLDIEGDIDIVPPKGKPGKTVPEKK